MGDDKNIKDNDTEVEEIEEPTEYDESTWGKTVDGENVIDGFKFKGKQSFRKPKEYLEKLMVRGATGEINGSKFKILDARLKGIEIEVDLQIIETGKTGIEKKGIAVIKLYGPNKRKENSVTVTKSKKSDIKYVAIIAQKIIRPLIKQSLDLQENNLVTKKESVIKCGICHKTFNKKQGLKCHNTKMHGDQNKDQLENISNPTLHLSDEDDTDEDTSGEKVGFNPNEDKIYSSKCNQCDYEIKTKRKYELIQNGLKHKEVCKKNNNSCKKSHYRGNCNVCGFVANSEPNIKRHMRDKHDIMSVSTSPPLKKTKVVLEHHDEEKMDIDLKEIVQIDEDQENMEIDDIEKQRSKMMDKKVIAKAMKNEEEEEIFKNKRKLKEIKEKEQEDLEKEKIKKLAKQNKQKVKDEKKRIRKKSVKDEKVKANRVPNIKPIPKNISHLVNEGDMLYVVPGDGSCAPSSASAFLFKDEVFGTQLKKKMNNFIAEHWEKKYKYKTQCSKTSPFIRKIGGGGEVYFTDPDKLVEYLRTSEESVYMWSDSEDLAVISDMFQVKIKIITTKGATDENPTVNWIVPDEDMKEHADLKNAKLNEMILFHENDMHFNLIVSKDDDLVTKGSLSFRTNLGPFMKNDDSNEPIVNDMEAKNVNNENDNKSLKDENKLLKDQLKRLTEKFKFLEKDYQLCEEELKNKTEECENLRMQVKHQEEIIHLEPKTPEQSCDKCKLKEKECNNKEHTRKNHIINEGLNCSECKSEVSSINQLVKHIIKNHGVDMINSLKCTKCGFQCSSKTHVTEHLKSKHDKEYGYEGSASSYKGVKKHQQQEHITSEHIKEHDNRCYKCDFQGGDENELRNHLKSIHVIDEEHNCNQCGFQGTSSKEIRNHILKKHMINCTECDYYCDNKEVFETHKQLVHANIDTFRCRICGETFKSKPELMNHRKKEHIKTVAFCRNMMQGVCQFSNQKCWWNHETQSENERKTDGNFNCYTCNENFNTKGKMMIHKKEKHRHLVRSCNLFIDDKCPHNDSMCWYVHEDNFINENFDENNKIEDQRNTQSVFQEVQENLKPPIGNI